MNEIERKIDDLGRIVIPITYRKALALKDGDAVTVSMENDKLIITPLKKICVVCGKKIEGKNDIRICKSCINAIKEKESGE